MRSFRVKAAVVAVAVASALFAGCTAVRTVPPPAAPAADFAGEIPERPTASVSTDAPLARMGYTIQVGAFAVLDNARALAGDLAAAGLDAFYFPSGSALFKVRFGNYPTRGTALAEARKLKAAGRIAEYMIVGPDEYAVVKPGSSAPAGGRPAPLAADIRESLKVTAEGFIGVDYAWGGTSTRSGFDCSGLAQAVYQLNGLAMPRSVRDQSRAGTAVVEDRLMKGDLVFFSAAPGGEISHVGIYIGDGTFIHAPGSGKNVRRESLGSAYFKSHYAGARFYIR